MLVEIVLWELEEEIGLKGENLCLFVIYDLFGKSGGGYFLLVFLVDCLECDNIKVLDDVLEVGWYFVVEVVFIVVLESVIDCIVWFEVWCLIKIMLEI